MVFDVDEFEDGSVICVNAVCNYVPKCAQVYA